MANILEFIRGLLTDDESQRLFRADPEGYVTRGGFDDMTGEDVVEAVLVLRRSLPADVTSALGDFDDATRLPRIRPTFEERDLDAALRQLHHAVGLVAGIDGEPVHHEPIAVEVEAELAEPYPGPPTEQEEPAPFWTAREPERPHQPMWTTRDDLPEPVREPAWQAEPEVVEAPQSEPEAQQPAPEEPPVPASDDPAGHPASQAFAEALDRAADDARSLLQEYADDVWNRLSALVADAERDAESIRSAAEADRNAARQVLAEAREEADRIRAEAEQGREDLQRRRTELREAETELRERLSGLEGVFRTVLRDD